MNELDPKFTILTITTQTTETEVTLYPPLTEAKETQRLNFHKPTLWFKFNRLQEIKQIASEKVLDKQTIDFTTAYYNSRRLLHLRVFARTDNKRTR